MTDSLQIRDADPSDVEIIRALADETWRECYPGIISKAQIEYMLGWMYSAEKILAEMKSESICYLLAESTHSDSAKPTGFGAFGPGESEDEIFLHKLYVRPRHQRQGIGAALLAEIERRACESGVKAISLRVNRANTGAIRAYEKAGFVSTTTVCSDIGGGFIMDDFVMTRDLASPGR